MVGTHKPFMFGRSLVVIIALVASAIFIDPPSSSAQFVPTGLGPTAPIFAPGTDPAYMQKALAGPRTPVLGFALEAAQPSRHWSARFTALNNGGSAQGDSLELTWSIVPDGTTMIPSTSGVDAACDSDLIATFDGIFGAGNWQNEVQRVWDQWEAETAIKFTPAVPLDADGNPVDDGADWPVTSGLADVRGDIRIGGCEIDGNGRTLAYNYLPDFGDMKIDTADSFYTTASLAEGVHNLLSHELGHGIGLRHTCPIDRTKLMEPILTTAFVGMQHDDIRGAQRGYGDRFEVIGNPNNSKGAATPLSFDAASGRVSETSLSLDSTGDRDWFSVDVVAGDRLDVTVTPVGLTYLEGPTVVGELAKDQGPCDTVKPAGALNSLQLQDLSLELHDGDGLIVAVDAVGSGVPEQLLGVEIEETGTYFLRVSGVGANDTQLYDLQIAQQALAEDQPTKIGNRVWNDDGDGVFESGEEGVSGVVIDLLDSSGDVELSRTTNVNGYWSMRVDPGRDWQLRVTPPAGRAFAPQNVGGDDETDSDADPATGLIELPVGTLTPDGVDKSFDTGLIDATVLPAKIGNRVWDDVNSNGIFDPGEPGVAGVLVQLYNDNDEVELTRTTSSGGYWSMRVDPTTSWNLEFVLPPGRSFTTQDAGGNDELDSDADPATGLIALPAGTLDSNGTDKSFDAGLRGVLESAATIGNRVWQDTNGNGRANTGEPGVGGVLVNIVNSDGDIIETLTTTTTGYWTTNIDTGQAWTIEIVAPAGYEFTIQDDGGNDNVDSDADAGGTIDIPLGTLSPGDVDKTFDAGLVEVAR